MICFYHPNFSAPLRLSVLFFLMNRETRLSQRGLAGS
jgi:hypothetical protein